MVGVARRLRSWRGGAMLFSTLTGNRGSIALLGSSLVPEMEKRVYKKPFAGAILGRLPAESDPSQPRFLVRDRPSLCRPTGYYFRPA